MEMKKSLIVAASALAMAATPAFANTTTSGNAATIHLSADVTAQCGVGNHMSGSDTGAGDQTDITVPLADANGQFKTAQTFNRSFGNVWCNAPATVTVSATPLTEDSGAAVGDTDSFTNRFDLQVSGGAMNAYVGGQTVDTSVAGGDTKHFDMPTAFETGTGQYSSVDIKVLPSLRSGEPRRAIAGTYTGAVTLTATIS
jgi:hypothetical protein